MTVSVTGNWTDLITASDIQDVSYDSALDQTVIDLHPLTRAQVPESQGDRDRYLIDTPGIPDAVSELGRAITSHATTDTERLHAIFSWMFRRIRYQHNFDPPSCVEVVKELKGDCSEFASLMVLLCRSVGMPAREITGLAAMRMAAWDFLLWMECWSTGNWMSVDPTWVKFSRLISASRSKEAECRRFDTLRAARIRKGLSFLFCPGDRSRKLAILVF